MKVVSKKLADVIIMNREGKLSINGGFDGVYGTIALEEKDKVKIQTHLTEF